MKTEEISFSRRAVCASINLRMRIPSVKTAACQITSINLSTPDLWPKSCKTVLLRCSKGFLVLKKCSHLCRKPAISLIFTHCSPHQINRDSNRLVQGSVVPILSPIVTHGETSHSFEMKSLSERKSSVLQSVWGGDENAIYQENRVGC